MTTSPSTNGLLRVQRRPSSDLRLRVGRYLDTWLATLDPDLRQAMVDPKSWWVIAAFVALLLVLLSAIPAARAFFSLDPVLAGLCFLPTLLLGLFVGALQKHGRLSLRRFGVLCVLGSALFQWSTWAFVALSSLPGAAVMAATPILLAAYHGHAFRSAARYPFIAGATVVAVTAALPLARSTAHTGIFIVGLSIAVTSSIVLGQNANQRGRALNEREALREAVNAQLLSERTSRAEHLAQLLVNLRTNNHDASNALSGALMNMELLLERLEAFRLDDDRTLEVVTLTTDVVSSLRNLGGVIEDARTTSKGALDMEEDVDSPSVLGRVLREMSIRFPDVQFRLADVSSECRLLLIGGAPVLERIARNLLVNAAEGDGASRPRKVNVECAWAHRTLEFTVTDDGPGFRADQLVATSTRTPTTKAWGSGLGLYTVRKLAAAQGGSLELVNLPSHGARVRVVLPSADWGAS